MKHKKRFVLILLPILGLLVAGYILIGRFSGVAALIVESNPPANIYINGKHLGVTPYKYEGKPGELLLSLIPRERSLYKYETLLDLKRKAQTIVRRKFEGEQGSSGSVIYFSEAPLNENYLQVTSVPDGANVSVSDHGLGNSPLRVPLSPGEHEVRVSLDGYIPYTATIKTESGLVTNVRVDLEKLP